MIRREMLIAVLLCVAGCNTNVQTNPARTATEELLISNAAERSAAQFDLYVPAKKKVFVDSSNFEGTDSKYAVSTIRTVLLKRGAHIVDDRKNAEIIVELRAGALSTDRSNFLIGIPQFNVPIPFSSSPLPIPELAIYGSDEQKGVAKLAGTAYDAKTGALVDAQDPQYGFSHNTKKTILIFFGWTDNDALPPGADTDRAEGKNKPASGKANQ